MYFQAWHGRKQAAWAIKATPRHKSARSASELHATSTAYLIRSEYWPVLQLCSEALGRKRGVTTDTPRVPKQQHRACVRVRITATNSTAAALLAPPFLWQHFRHAIVRFSQRFFSSGTESLHNASAHTVQYSHFQLLLMKTRRSHDAEARC